MTPTSSPHDAAAALNQVLSEVIDEVQEVKQAHRKISETHHLHAALDRLFDDLRTWAGLLMDRDLALGVTALGRIPSVAGRAQPNPWPGPASDEDVRRVVSGHLDRLAQHVAAARLEQDDDESETVLAGIEDGLRAHQRELGES